MVTYSVTSSLSAFPSRYFDIPNSLRLMVKVASNPDLWLWQPKDDLQQLRDGEPVPQVVQAVYA